MRLTKFTHACVRLERADAVLVIDPGGFSEDEALTGVDAVLITHEHFDHLDLDKLIRAATARPEFTVYAHPDVTEQLTELGERVQVRPVQPGEEFTAAGFRVRVGGGAHAVIHADIPQISNVGFLIEDSLYHPGDSLNPADLPAGTQVETLLLPVQAPWAKLAESVDYARAVAPQRAYALHDHLLSADGSKVYDTNLGKLSGCDYQRLEPGTGVNL